MITERKEKEWDKCNKATFLSPGETCTVLDCNTKAVANNVITYLPQYSQTPQLKLTISRKPVSSWTAFASICDPMPGTNRHSTAATDTPYCPPSASRFSVNSTETASCAVVREVVQELSCERHLHAQDSSSIQSPLSSTLSVLSPGKWIRKSAGWSPTKGVQPGRNNGRKSLNAILCKGNPRPNTISLRTHDHAYTPRTGCAPKSARARTHTKSPHASFVFLSIVTRRIVIWIRVHKIVFPALLSEKVCVINVLCRRVSMNWPQPG